MKNIDPELIRARIHEVARIEAELPDAVAADVALHMTDWLNDLDAYSRFCADPSKMSDAEVSQLLINFLIHVPNHIAAASKLYAGVPVTDIFKVDSIADDTNEVG